MSINLTKRVVAVLGIVTLATGTLLGVPGSAKAAETWDLPIAWPEKNFHVVNVKIFAQEVEKATNGEVKINVHSGGSMGFKGPEMLKVVRDGLVPIGEMLINQQVGEAPIVGIEGLPYLVKDIDELKILHKHYRPVLDEVAAKFNQKVLYVVPWPIQYIYTKVPVSKLEDLKGIKVRTTDRTSTEIFKLVGMTAVQLPWGETVPALASGAIDAVTTAASLGADASFWEFLKYMYPTNHVWGSNMVTVNLDAWNKLKEGHRKAIIDVAGRLEAEFWEVSRREDTDKSKILTDNGVVKGAVGPQMLKRMQDLTKAMMKRQIGAMGPKAEAVVKAFLAEVGR